MRSSIAVQFTLLGLVLSLAGCSEQGTASQANAPLKVETGELFLTVQNEAGVALTDLTVTIIPRTRTTKYTKALDRLENTQSHDIMLGDFMGRDGTPFNLRVARPNTVEVKGVGSDGKTYEVTVPWK